MKHGREILDALPELPTDPFEVAGRLGRARNGPYVTVLPHARPAPKAPALPLQPSRSSHAVRRYWVWVTYPHVMCSSPGDLLDGLSIDLGQPPSRRHPHDPRDLAGVEHHYKLSTLDGVKFAVPLFCTVKYGPWSAVVVETEQCLPQAPTQWELTVPGMAGVDLVWFGTWADMPSFPNLTVVTGSLTLASSTSECCPGFKWCPTTQSCIPFAVNCQTPVPF